MGGWSVRDWRVRLETGRWRHSRKENGAGAWPRRRQVEGTRRC